MITLVFVILALVLFILAGIGVPAPPRYNLIAFGLACCVAAWLSGHGALH